MVIRLTYMSLKNTAQVEMSVSGPVTTRRGALYLTAMAKGYAGTTKRYGGGMNLLRTDGGTDLVMYSYSKLRSRTIHIKHSELCKTGETGLGGIVRYRWGQLGAQLGAYFGLSSASLSGQEWETDLPSNGH